MSEKTTTPEQPQAATYAQIVAACKGCDPDNSGDDAKFVTSCLKADMTIEQAQGEWMNTLSARIESANEENTKLKADAGKTTTSTKPAANKPLEDGDTNKDGKASTSADPVAEWNAKIAEKVATGMSKRQAASAVNRENPGLRQAALEQWNS